MMEVFVYCIVSSVITLMLKCGLVLCQNIDTGYPILRAVSGLDERSLFGYSTVLHQTLSNSSSMNESISGVR